MCEQLHMAKTDDSLEIVHYKKVHSGDASERRISHVSKTTSDIRVGKDADEFSERIRAAKEGDSRNGCRSSLR
nr:hypothetical protein [Tanacetum cinerariifolium]